jgi:trans-aconitate 2-methyltransferase
MHKWDPETYEKSSSPQKEWAEDLLAKITLRGNEKILDIGSGDGKITAKIASLIPQGSVLGIDNSHEMVIFAQRKYPPSIWPNLSFQYGDASDLKYENEFDLVTSFACLHWILDQRPVLAGIRRCLRRGGKVFLQFGGKGNAIEILEVVNKVISGKKWSSYFQNFTFPYGFFGIEEYRSWLDQSGLRTIRTGLIPKDMIQPDLYSLSSWIEATWLPYTSRVPDKLRYEFIQEIAKNYIESNPPGKDDKLHLKMVRLEVEAEKP